MMPGTGSLPRRARHLIPMGLPRRGELMAGCAVLIIGLHLLLAPVTFALTAVFAVLSRVSRWRLWWLSGPALAGLAWVLLAGPGDAVAGFAAGPARVLSYLAGGHLLASRSRPPGALAGAAGWLPRQFPLALIAAAAEAALIGWLSWLRTDEWAVPPPRPGVVAMLRGALATQLIRAGAVLTRDGCALGTALANGAIVTLSWAEVAGGVLVTGASEQAVTVASLQLAHAALRRRKPLIVLDLSAGATVGRAVAAACAATGVRLHVSGTEDALRGRPAAGPLAPGGASGLWGQGAATGLRQTTGTDDGQASAGPADAVAAQADLCLVIRERSAVLLRPVSAAGARAACAGIAALSRDLRRIEVDGDGLVWICGAERLPAETLATLLPGGPASGLPALLSTASPAAAMELAGLVSVVLMNRIADPGCATRLAARTGTRLRPATMAGTRTGAAGGQQGTAADLAGAADLVPFPAVPPRTLLALGAGEFVLAVSSPRNRLVERGRLVPARLPPAAAARRADHEHASLPRARTAAVYPAGAGAEAGWRESVP